jgi:zinc/manganese transport system substrate-binding protein
MIASNTTTSPRRPLSALLVIVVSAILVAACAESDGSETDARSTDELTVIATTTIWGDVAAEVVGDQGVVEVLMPIGADPHDYQASSRQIASLAESDLVIANGLGLEESLDDALEGLEADGVRVLEIGPLVDPLPFGVTTASDAATCDPEAAHAGHDEEASHAAEEDADHDEDEGDRHGDEADGHDHEDACDPHVWLDPIRVAAAADAIASALREIEPEGDWMANADGYAARLEWLHADSTAKLSAIPESSRVLVTNHDALGYFADRYGFEIVGTVIPGGTTLGEPSSRELAELVETMKEYGVRQPRPSRNWQGPQRMSGWALGRRRP